MHKVTQRELINGAILMIDRAVADELSLDAQFCVGCLLSVKEVLNKVLAEPERNCDRYRTAGEARRAWNHQVKNFGDWVFEVADNDSAIEEKGTEQ